MLTAVSIVAGEGGILDSEGGQDTRSGVVSTNGGSVVALAVNAQLKRGFRQQRRSIIDGDHVRGVDVGEAEAPCGCGRAVKHERTVLHGLKRGHVDGVAVSVLKVGVVDGSDGLVDRVSDDQTGATGCVGVVQHVALGVQAPTRLGVVRWNRPDEACL